jgi:aminoglycoside 6'-N-acetyltransferase I
MNISIQEVDKEHFPEWCQMREALFTGLDEDFHQQEMVLIFNAEDRTCFMAYSNEIEPIGFIELSLRNLVDGCLSSPVGYIEGIYLKPEYRSAGYGRQLIDWAEAWFKEKGCTEMATDVEIDNLDAQKFHSRVGFKETYRIVEYKKSLEAT